MVTANLPPFGTQAPASTSPYRRSATARACKAACCWSLPLLGADGNVYAVAQGSVAIGGFQAEGEAAKIVRGVPTVAAFPTAR